MPCVFMKHFGANLPAFYNEINLKPFILWCAQTHTIHTAKCVLHCTVCVGSIFRLWEGGLQGLTMLA